MSVTNFIPPTRSAGRSANDTAEKMRILVAEDDSESLRFITDTIERLGHVPVTAGNGKEAVEILRTQGPQIDVIFLDRIMPYMDGVAVLQFIAHDPVLKQIPVILQSSAAEDKMGSDTAPAGIFYTLAKPYEVTILQGILSAAVRQSQKNHRLERKMSHHQVGFNLISSAKFRFRTLEEAEGLACFIANCFPEPEHVVTGLAELMINAIEHGNLRIGAQEKEDLLNRGTWLAEVEKRLADPVYNHLHAEIAVTRRDGGIYVVITDQGEGFEWQNYIKIDPERAARASGRGIAHAATICFDSLRYDHIGNKAIAFVQERRPLSW
ncbi:MAG: response regulator [Alphaproteobacteria bacterium]|nr:response regulator [Alphaproteobacteria bacterium]MBU0859626.1 response regulator [Alphaproteobacteria bacterium]